MARACGSTGGCWARSSARQGGRRRGHAPHSFFRAPPAAKPHSVCSGKTCKHSKSHLQTPAPCGSLPAPQAPTMKLEAGQSLYEALGVAKDASQASSGLLQAAPPARPQASPPPLPVPAPPRRRHPASAHTSPLIPAPCWAAQAEIRKAYMKLALQSCTQTRTRGDAGAEDKFKTLQKVYLGALRRGQVRALLTGVAGHRRAGVVTSRGAQQPDRAAPGAAVGTEPVVAFPAVRAGLTHITPAPAGARCTTRRGRSTTRRSWRASSSTSYTNTTAPCMPRYDGSSLA